jgi:alpha,alpha-trehalase
MPRPSIAMTSSQSSAVASTTDASGFVLRYRTGETDDGMSGKEGHLPHLLVLARVRVGDHRRGAAGRDLMERLLRVASPLGLFAEEFDVDTGRHLGNFPQAFPTSPSSRPRPRSSSLSG